MTGTPRRLSLNGLSFAVDDQGSGPAIILLHGYPDDRHLWAKMAPLLRAQGFRTIAPDLRGFGDTDIAPRAADYRLADCLVPDVLALMDKLALPRAYLVGHDWGAALAWAVAALVPDRVERLAVLSVGHPTAVMRAGLEQKLRSWYMLFHKMTGLAEAVMSAAGGAVLTRLWADHPERDRAVDRLMRPGRLTAGLNWYRANVPLAALVGAADLLPSVPADVVGLWSSGERYLTEAGMTDSEGFVRGRFAYHRIDAASHWIPLDAPQEAARHVGTFFKT